MEWWTGMTRHRLDGMEQNRNITVFFTPIVHLHHRPSWSWELARSHLERRQHQGMTGCGSSQQTDKPMMAPSASLSFPPPLPPSSLHPQAPSSWTDHQDLSWQPCRPCGHGLIHSCVPYKMAERWALSLGHCEEDQHRCLGCICRKGDGYTHIL